MKNIFLKYLLPLLSVLGINLVVIAYWSTKCSTAISDSAEYYFYCDMKGEAAGTVFFTMGAAVMFIFLIGMIITIINLLVKNKKNKIVIIISKILVVLGIIVFVLSHVFWFRLESRTLKEFEVQQKEARKFWEQKEKEYLESDENKRISEEAFQRSCELAKKGILENPNVLIPIGCE